MDIKEEGFKMKNIFKNLFKRKENCAHLDYEVITTFQILSSGSTSNHKIVKQCKCNKCDKIFTVIQ